MTWTPPTARTTPPVARVLSLGAGVQSSTLAIMAARGETPDRVDFAVFADTQAEPASVYTWLDRLDAIVQASPYPFPILRVTAGSLEEAQLRIRVRQKGERAGIPYVLSLIPAFAIDAAGKVGMYGRTCTYHHKILPVYRAIRDRLGVHAKRTPPEWWVEQWIGISTDEAIRMKPARPHWLENRWPLIDADMKRSDCLRYMAALDLHPPRSACTFCPFHAPDEWARLQRDEPDDYAAAVRFEVALQAAVAHDPTATGVPYLTRTGRMLGDIDWASETADPGQLDMWPNECEGMCGV